MSTKVSIDKSYNWSIVKVNDEFNDKEPEADPLLSKLCKYYFTMPIKRTDKGFSFCFK